MNLNARRRMRLGWSLEMLARRVGTTKVSIWRYEQGRTPQNEAIEKAIDRALKLGEKAKKRSEG